MNLNGFRMFRHNRPASQPPGHQPEKQPVGTGERKGRKSDPIRLDPSKSDQKDVTELKVTGRGGGRNSNLIKANQTYSNQKLLQQQPDRAKGELFPRGDLRRKHVFAKRTQIRASGGAECGVGAKRFQESFIFAKHRPRFVGCMDQQREHPQNLTLRISLLTPSPIIILAHS